MAEEEKPLNPITGKPMTKAEMQRLQEIAKSPSEEPPPGVDPAHPENDPK